MKKLYLLLILSGFTVANAQITWEKKINVHYDNKIAPGFSTGIVETPDKGFIVAGTGTQTTGSVGYLYKLDKNGDSVWKKTFTGQRFEGMANVFYSRSGKLMTAMQVNILDKKSNIIIAEVNENTGDTSNSFLVPKPNNADGYLYTAHVELEDGSYALVARDVSSFTAGASHFFRFMPGATTHMWDADSLAYRVWTFYDIYLDNGSLILTGNGGTGSLRHNGIVVKYGLDGKPRWDAPFTHGGEWTTTFMMGSVKAADGKFIAVGDKIEIVGGVWQNTPAVGLVSATGDTLKYASHSNKIPGTILKIIKTANGYFAIGSGTITQKDPDGKDKGLRSMTLYQVTEDGNFELVDDFNSGFQPATTGGGYMSTETSGLKIMTASDGDLVLLGSGALARTDKTTYSVPYIIKMKAPTAGVGISETIQMNKLTVYPNPATTNMVISTNSLQGKLRIINLTGQEVYSMQINNNENISVDVKHFPAGAYMVQLINASGISTTKFIKAD